MEKLAEATAFQKTIFAHWAGQHWPEVEQNMEVFREWSQEFHAYAIRRAKSVCEANILDYREGQFVNWATGVCLNVFRMEWDATPRQKQFIFASAMSSVNLIGILKKCNCPEDDIEDVAQEVSVRVWLAFNRYDPRKAQFLTWVYSIARNTVYDIYRKRVRSGRNNFTVIPLTEDWVGNEDNPISELMELLNELEANGQLALVRSIQGYLNGECDMPDPKELQFYLLEDSNAKAES